MGTVGCSVASAQPSCFCNNPAHCSAYMRLKAGEVGIANIQAIPSDKISVHCRVYAQQVPIHFVRYNAPPQLNFAFYDGSGSASFNINVPRSAPAHSNAQVYIQNKGSGLGTEVTMNVQCGP